VKEVFLQDSEEVQKVIGRSLESMNLLYRVRRMRVCF
jgi:hypothetical protein